MLLNLPKSRTFIFSTLHPNGTCLYFVLSRFALTLPPFHSLVPHHRSVFFVMFLSSCTFKVSRNRSVLYLEMQHWQTVFVVVCLAKCLAVCPKDSHSQKNLFVLDPKWL